MQGIIRPLLVLVCMASACGEASAPAPEPAPAQEPPVAAPVVRLYEHAIRPSDSAVEFTMDKITGRHLQREMVAPLAGGQIEIRTRGKETQLMSAVAKIEDMVVEPSFLPPSGLVMTSLVLTVTPSEAMYLEGEGRRGFFEGPFDVRLEWALVSPSGAPQPLNPILLKGVQMVGQLVRASDGHVNEIELYAELDGEFWRWGDLLELSDLTVLLRAGLASP